MPFCLRLFFSLPLPTGAKSHTRSELLPGFRPRQRFTAFFGHKGLSDQPNKRLKPPYSPAITRNRQRVIISRPSFFRPQTKILSKHPVFSSMDENFTHFGIFFVCGRKKQYICEKFEYERKNWIHKKIQSLVWQHHWLWISPTTLYFKYPSILG